MDTLNLLSPMSYTSFAPFENPILPPSESFCQLLFPCFVMDGASLGDPTRAVKALPLDFLRSS